jgi:hypothetical protein
VRSGVLLLRPEADSRQLTGMYRRGFPGEEAYLTFHYQVVRVWQLPPEPLLTGGLGLLPLAPISAVTEPELPGIIQRMERRLSSRRGRRLARAVWGSAFILLGLRYSAALAERLFRGVVSMRESSTYQAILQEGHEEGRRMGREEGRTEGALVEARKLLRKFGGQAFGPPDSGTVAAIEQIDDLARLEELCDRLSAVGSWQELLGRPTPGRRGGRRRRTP